MNPERGAPDAPLVSVIIVTWNCRDYVLRCLQTMHRTKQVTYEIIIRDNGSQDGTVQAIQQRYPSVKLIGDGRNVGFSKANNEGIHCAQGEYLLLLNPDTEIPPNTLCDFVRAARKYENRALLVPTLLNPDGTIQPSGSRRFPTLGSVAKRFKDTITKHVIGSNYESNSNEQHIAWALGACFFIPVNVYEAVGGLDEHIFMYGEDLDYCWRVHQTGFEVIRIPQIELIHHGNVSGAQKWKKDRVKKLSQARLYFWRKHFGSLYASAAALAQILLFTVQGFWHLLLSGIRSSQTHRARAQERLRYAEHLLHTLFQ